MVLKILIGLFFVLAVTRAQAEEGTITVDAPLMCLSETSMAAVVRYYYEGGFDLANSFVDEYAEDCFMMGETQVPHELTEQLVVLWRGVSIEYGYIPVPFGGMEFFMFFIRVWGDGEPV
jgi:hypothetical protein